MNYACRLVMPVGERGLLKKMPVGERGLLKKKNKPRRLLMPVSLSGRMAVKISNARRQKRGAEEQAKKITDSRKRKREDGCCSPSNSNNLDE